MKKHRSGILIAAFFLLALGGSLPLASLAATSPSLGSESSYGVVTGTYTNSLNAALETAIHGDVCYTTGPATAPVSISGATVVPCPPGAGTDQALALANLNAQADAVSCTNLGTDVVLSGTYAPGCYTASGAMSIVLNTTVTLSGAGTYIFRSGGALTAGANSQVLLSGGAAARDVFWASGGAVHLGANAATSPTPTFVGNIIAPTGITLGHFANLLGRALSYGGTVTTDANTISLPPPPAMLKVIKTVMNTNGQTKTVNDFPLFVNGASVISGAINTFPPGAYAVTETSNPNYAAVFSGACDAGGNVSLAPGDNKTCTITNSDIAPPPPVPPLISVIKVPSPLNLPAGPGPVTYTYTLHNIGTVPVTNITMNDDSCGPVAFVSGDTNSNSILDVTETWTFACSTTLAATRTNIITATGQANGLSATDTATATVVVGVPVVPPLIHVTNIPSPLTLAAGGGAVTYTETITNPGTVALNNVSIADDRCAAVVYVSGDANGNSLLEPAESWIFSCHANVISSTTNTATASGAANSLTATDTAAATVLVAAAIPVVPDSLQKSWLTVVKIVVNDNGGTKTVADFPLFVNGTPVLSGGTNAFNLSSQMYHVSETGNAQYARSFSGDCDINGDVLLNRGDRKICIVTNNDIGAPVVAPPIPPLIDLIKIPSPLALPNGPGVVTYTYTLKNIGTVPVTDITMIDDACSRISLVSGDTNGDAKLQVNETWKYVCSATLNETQTGTVTATAWANGVSTTDIASAIVVVGAPVIPPLIHVTIIPNPLVLRAGGGVVAYTEKITNPGTVPLANVTLTNDKCAPMKYVSGDTNNDSKLDPAETWTYTCTAKLTKTATNTTTASGTANGMMVRDLAIATVVVAPVIPKFPNTGFAPTFSLKTIITLAGSVLALIAVAFAAFRKQNI
jgi:uncharacterized repeat protein (TIGR01451 family)